MKCGLNNLLQYSVLCLRSSSLALNRTLSRLHVSSIKSWHLQSKGSHVLYEMSRVRLNSSKHVGFFRRRRRIKCRSAHIRERLLCCMSHRPVRKLGIQKPFLSDLFTVLLKPFTVTISLTDSEGLTDYHLLQGCWASLALPYQEYTCLQYWADMSTPTGLGSTPSI